MKNTDHNKPPELPKCKGRHFNAPEKECGGSLEPQAAGRRVHYQFLPYVCSNPLCQNFGVPFNVLGQRKSWDEFANLVQI